MMRQFQLACLILMLSWGTGACAARRPFEAISLQTLASSVKTPLEPCAAAKCLTVYVAPWCPYCRAATPMILALRDYLKSQGVITRIVVGQDAPDAVRKYAETFGPGTFLDPNGWVKVGGGVPAFLVTDPSGRLLTGRSGAPRDAEAPFDNNQLTQIAHLYGLP